MNTNLASSRFWLEVQYTTTNIFDKDISQIFFNT